MPLYGLVFNKLPVTHSTFLGPFWNCLKRIYTTHMCDITADRMPARKDKCQECFDSSLITHSRWFLATTTFLLGAPQAREEDDLASNAECHCLLSVNSLSVVSCSSGSLGGLQVSVLYSSADYVNHHPLLASR